MWVSRVGIAHQMTVTIYYWVMVGIAHPTTFFPKSTYLGNYMDEKGNCNDHQLRGYKEAGITPPQNFYNDTQKNVQKKGAGICR